MAIPGIVGTATGGRSGSGAFTVTPPAGAAGYVAVASWRGTLTQLTAPSGWTALSGYPLQSGSDDYTMVGIWTAGASPGSSWSHGTSNGGASVVVVGYDGALTVHQSAGSSATLTCPSVTTSEGSLLLRVVMRQAFNGTPTFTYPASATLGRNQHNQLAASEYWSEGVAHESRAATGSTGTAAFTANATQWSARAHTLALTTEAAETPSGGSVVGVATATVQAGQSIRRGASAAPQASAAVGAGAKSTAGSSTAAVGVTDTAQGSTVRTGGSVVTVGTTAVQAGLAARTGGSTVGVDTSTTSAGEAVRTGSSVSGVDVATVGAGTPVESGQGGSTTGVGIGAVGAGAARRTGSSTSGVTITTTGAGTAVQPGQGGSVVGVGVTTVGAGRKAAAASSVAHVTTTTLGAGWAARHGAGTTGVLVAVVAGGHNPGAFTVARKPRASISSNPYRAVILKTAGTTSLPGNPAAATITSASARAEMT